MKIHDSTYKKRITVMIDRTSLTMTLFSLTLISMSIGFLVSLPLQTTTFAQLSSPSPAAPLTEEQVEESDLLAEFQAARQAYLSEWNSTAFSSQFDVFVAEGSVGLYGQYREHLPANVFRPGETIVLYMEPVGFGHQPITDTTVDGSNGTDNASRTMYLIDMTADMYGTDSSGAQVFAIEDIPVATNLISHRQMTETPLTLTLTQEEPFPVGDYVITYVVHDHLKGQSFQIDRQITIDDDAVTGAAPLPDISSQNSIQPLLPQQQLE
jgi:hypothetical protein